MNNDTLLMLTRRLIEQLQESSPQKKEGIFATACPDVDLFYQTCGQNHRPTLYNPGFVFLFSGEKSAQLGAKHYVYNPEQGLLLTGVYPVYCDATASEEEPLIGVQIRFDRLQVAQLLHELSHHAEKSNTSKLASVSNSKLATKPNGFLAVTITPAIQAALFGLLNTLHDIVACELFIQTYIRNLIYAALEQPDVRLFIEGWVAQDGRYTQFLKATDYILSHLTSPISLEEIALQAGMSIPTLLRTFKHYTAESPMQYVKKLRLSYAYVELNQTTCSVQEAAHAVGYESVSQFSREYKRYFGHSPRQRQ